MSRFKDIITYWSLSETTAHKLPSFLRANAGQGVQTPGLWDSGQTAPHLGTPILSLVN